ncbi:MAG: hypothetical protein JNG84_10250 [Archangium sp.]|nr:hypothetical protein [Archangium sp.]
MFRRFAMVVLAFGVVAGYGSAFASFRYHRQACHGRWHDSEWRDSRAEPAAAPAPVVIAPPAPAPTAVAPVVVQQPAPAAAAPNVFIIMPGANGAVPTVVAPAAAHP